MGANEKTPAVHPETDAPIAEADVVVIGAGSSGAVIVRRLVDAGVRVVLIEAGGPDTNPAIHDPQQVLTLAGGPEDYSYQTVPQRHMHGRRLGWARGKVLGGSSAINGMIHVRGFSGDFDHWAYLGNYGWDYASVLELFKKSEDNDRGASEYHGAGGLWPVKTQYRASPLHESFIEAAAQAGIPTNDDYNGENIEGAALVQFSVDGVTRATTAHSFLHGVDDAPNLTVLTRTVARRLLFEGARCVGVEVQTADGSVGWVKALDEVVVSAGAVDSPRILTLSGIADRDELERLGIAEIVDLPGVGQNLSDHLLVPLIYGINTLPPQGEAGIPPQGSQLFWKSRPELFSPDLQPLVFSLPMYTDGLSGPDEAFTIAPGIVRPASLGSIRLATADPAGELLIDPDYFSASIDMDAMVAAVELCRSIAAQPALTDQWDAHELTPGREVTGEALREYIRKHVWSYWHPVGTCKMGVDVEAVVDPELRVYGVTGLRVADASIMPSVTSGNTAAPCVMIGEKAAELILSTRQSLE